MCALISYGHIASIMYITKAIQAALMGGHLATFSPCFLLQSSGRPVDAPEPCAAENVTRRAGMRDGLVVVRHFTRAWLGNYFTSIIRGHSKIT